VHPVPIRYVLSCDENAMKPKTRLSRAPRIYPLPHSPTGWNEARDGERASIAGPEDDPDKPAGVLDDSGGLPAAADRARLARRGLRRRRR
jgi:hypothetical protein